MKILIIGHARHGKDTLAEILNKEFGLTFKSSSMAAAEIFIYATLKETYGYNTPDECFEDRVNHRKEWFDLITEYNSVDKTALAAEILSYNDMYVGMRDSAEIEGCNAKGMFDFVVGVFNPSLPLEAPDSFNIDLWDSSDFVIPNSGTLEEFEKKIIKVFLTLLNVKSYE
jgi:dephospho-CoA kinase